MARQRRNTTSMSASHNRINWLTFFQSLDSFYGRIAIIVSIISLGFGAGYFSSGFVKDREIVLLEREYNDLKSNYNIQNEKFETERSDHKVEINEMKIKLLNAEESLKNAKKR